MFRILNAIPSFVWIIASMAGVFFFFESDFGKQLVFKNTGAEPGEWFFFAGRWAREQWEWIKEYIPWV